MSMFIPSAVWRRERAGIAIMRACDLLETPLSPEQLGAVHQILFESVRLFLDARANIGPLAEVTPYVGERAPLNDHEMSSDTEEAKDLSKRLVRDPQNCIRILQEVWP